MHYVHTNFVSVFTFLSYHRVLTYVIGKHPMPLKITESIIFKLGFADNQPEPAAPTVIQTSSSISCIPLNPLTASAHNSASQWISLPLPAMHAMCVLPKLRYGANQRSSPLGPKLHKHYRHVFPHSLPKPNLYCQVLIASAKKAAELMAAL